MTKAKTPRQIRETVRRYAREHDLLRPGALVVAVSGGADSTALLLLLADLAPELGLVLHVAHFDHRVRRTGASDAQHVADLAASVGATIHVGRAERVPRSEDDARRARYAFLRRVAAERGAAAIATGHTRDDQAETVLLHLARGSGIAGLAGMRPSREGVVRPLLCIGRAETEAVCRGAGIAPREDPTNRSLRYARNRIRRKVLPELRAVNPQVEAALARLADSAAEAADAVRRAAERALAASERDGAIDLDALGTVAGDGSVADALALAWERATGSVLGSAHRDALAAMSARRDGSMSLDLPGGRAIREYAVLRLEPAAGSGVEGAEGGAARHDEPSSAPPGDLALSLGGSVEWNGWRIELLEARASADAGIAAAIPRPDAEGLVVRARRAGDRMAGASRARVQDLFTDAKVPMRQRSRMPVVVTRAGEVAWIPGIAAAWNAVSDGYVLVARPPAAWEVRIRAPGTRVASSYMGREGH
ncbi:MAG: tRNA lysidine(34) synthetase TilS [Chloroflexota bacterium]|nr:tRNA lysidine(34) synthetase TilS [Chloroflexota bacterium]